MGLVIEYKIKHLESYVAFDRVIFLSTDSVIKSVLVFCGHSDKLP